MEQQDCLTSTSFFICGAFYIIRGAFYFVCTAFLIICGALVVICGAIVMICGALIIICSALLNCHHYRRCFYRYMRCVLHYEVKSPEVWVRAFKKPTMQWALILRTHQFSIPSCLCSLGDIDMDTVLKRLKLEGLSKKLLKILMSTINHCCCGNHCFP